MDDCVFLDSNNVYLEAQLKAYPSDFKVIELTTDGTPCTTGGLSNENTQLTAKEFVKSSPQGIMIGYRRQHSADDVFFESAPPIKTAKTDQDNKEIRNKNNETVKVQYDVEYCEETLQALLPNNILDILISQKGAKNAVNLPNPLSLGKFEIKDDRTKVHKCVRYLYPHLRTITTNEHKIHVELCPIFRYFFNQLGEEKAQQFIRFATLKENCEQVFNIAASSLSKDSRRMIHRGIDDYFGKFLMSKTKSGNSLIEVKYKSRKDRKVKEKQFCKFVLYKRNCETLDAIHQLAKCFNAKPHQFSYAGTKDKNAETYQQMSVSGLSEQRLKDAAEKLPDHLRISDITFTSTPIRLGYLAGNRFQIILRHVRRGMPSMSNHNSSCRDDQLETSSLQHEVERSLRFAELNGFVNYFGSQRFGRKLDNDADANKAEHESCYKTEKYEASSVGLAILQQDMKKAVMLLLQPVSRKREEALNDEIDLEARMYFQTTGDFEGTIKKLHPSKVRELSILKALRKFGCNTRDLEDSRQQVSQIGKIPQSDTAKNGYAKQAYTKALLSLPHNTLLFYVHAYCSLVWNKAVTERLRHHARDIIEGDLVTSENKQIHVVNDDDIRRKLYSINDVVLPLPGQQTIYPPNLEVYYRNILRADGLLSGDRKERELFRSNLLKLKIPGSYRKLVEFPKHLKLRWILVQSSQRNLLDRSASDDDSSEQSRVSDDTNTDSTKQSFVDPKLRRSDSALELMFDLPSSCYATNFLMQISKNGIGRIRLPQT